MCNSVPLVLPKMQTFCTTFPDGFGAFDAFRKKVTCHVTFGFVLVTRFVADVRNICDMDSASCSLSRTLSLLTLGFSHPMSSSPRCRQ